MNKQNNVELEPFGERGWLARLSGFSNDVASGLFANAVADAMRAQVGITDAVAGIDSITIRFDDLHITADAAQRLLNNALETLSPLEATQTSAPIIEIPVLYGGQGGPDLDVLCKRAQLPAATLIEKHANATYNVVTVGFAPGFAYLGPLDENLHAPRLSTPRPRVAAGSVAVAGGFTGVYALPSPGGWNIIGQTPLSLFNAQSKDPFLFKPGAKIRFRSIDITEFKALAKKNK